MPTTTINHIGELNTLERNRFFYGKMMDVNQFEKDQRYFNSKRALINRLVLGNGVVCGFDVIPDPDAENRLLIQPGLAIDGSGCEIVSSEAISIDPHQLTNDQGVAEGDLIDSGTIEICLLYSEVETDLVPVLVPECDSNGNCAPCTIREEFRVLVRLTDDDPPSPLSCQFGDILSAGNGVLHGLLCERLRGSCPPVPDDPCVPIARVLLPLAEDSIDSCSVRPLIYNNSVLYELILCLTAQVEALGSGLLLRIVSGDGQTGAPGEQLSDPLVVEIIDSEGNPVTNVLVGFEVTEGGGSIGRRTRRTNRQGFVRTRWILGPEAGAQLVTVSAMGTAITVSFGANAE